MHGLGNNSETKICKAVLTCCFFAALTQSIVAIDSKQFEISPETIEQ